MLAAVGAQHGDDLFQDLQRVEAPALRLVLQHDVQQQVLLLHGADREQQVAQRAPATPAALRRVVARQRAPVDGVGDRCRQGAA